MTTKAPAAVQDFNADTLERHAYDSVSAIATREPNDKYRLGFHVYRFLNHPEGTLEETIIESGARLEISPSDAARIIREALAKYGLTV